MAIYEAWNTIMENTLNYLLLKQREHNILKSQYIRVPFSVVNCYLYVVNYGNRHV